MQLIGRLPSNPLLGARGFLWDAIGVHWSLFGAAFGPVWDALERPWAFFGSLWVALGSPVALSGKSLKIDPPGVPEVDFSIEVCSWNSPPDPADPADRVSLGAIRDLPSTPAGGQDDVSSHKPPQTSICMQSVVIGEHHWQARLRCVEVTIHATTWDADIGP